MFADLRKAVRSARIAVALRLELIDAKSIRIMEDRKMQNLKSFLVATQRCLSLIAVAACVVIPTTTALGQAPASTGSDSIWSPRYDGEAGAQGTCFFRKKFTLINPERATLQVVAEDSFELFINGQSVMSGRSDGEIYESDVSSHLKPGVNLVAIRVQNYDEEAPGLACKMRVKEFNETRWRSLRSDNQWKTRTTEIPNWNSTGYDDMSWINARVVIANHLSTDPNGNPFTSTPIAQTQQTQRTNTKPGSTPQQAEEVAKIETGNGDVMPIEPATKQKTKSRFKLDPEFRIQQVMSDEQTGSVIAMAFDEFNRLVFSQEGGPLMIAEIDSSGNRIRTICDQVTSCQGILPLNGDLFVTGDGPNGVGIYRLSKIGTSGKMSVKETLVRFKGDSGEHGPHGLQLGNDGMIYCIVGNDSEIETKTATTSPFQNEYQGDLVERYEDPGGHAAGIRGQGGTVIRLTLDGTKVETVAGGIRNAYDFAFDHQGDLFIHDSDMEADMGTSWYRPTAVSHVVAGADLGWRSGWAKFPEYFADTIPPAAKTGRGSPTGAILYQHIQFPARFHNSIFFADWSEGRILVAFPKAEGASKKVETEVFATGKPLNVTDLAVGQDGSLYFCTGGRGTNGGIYRIFWGGEVPESVTQYESDLAEIIRQPQANSAWARQKTAVMQSKMSSTWRADITGIAKETRNSADFRIRALDAMVTYGPFPGETLLEELALDEDEQVRARVAAICGLRESFKPILDKLITDSSANVRRHVCESYLRLESQPEASRLYEILKSPNRIETVAARRLLERIPVDSWIDDIVNSDDKRLFINGTLAAISAEPSLEQSYRILAKASAFMESFIDDAEFIDLLRVIQLAMVTGDVDPARVPAFVKQIKSEFPSSNGIINRELARAMAYLKIGGLENRLQDYLKNSTDSQEDKVHVAMYLQTVGSNLDAEERIALIDFLEQAKLLPGGGSYKLYLTRALTDLSATLTDDQIQTVLENGANWPTALIQAYYKLPTTLDQETIETLIKTDKELVQKQNVEKARLGIVALLGRNRDATSAEYLRKLWEQEPDRRSHIAIGLAQHPTPESWPHLVSSLPVLDDLSSIEVMERLTEINLRPKTPHFYREILQLGYRMENEGAELAAKLIQHWSGQEDLELEAGWKNKLDYWQTWYTTKFPNAPTVEMDAIESTDITAAYTTAQVLDFMDERGPGNPERGHDLFSSAQCASCHRYGAFGDSTGPDLTSLASRFSRREIVEAVLDPSKDVPARYRTKSILTKDGLQFNGMVVEDNGAYTVLQSDGKKIVVAETEVDKIKELETSAMPQGLLDNLSLEEINDLFTYMYSSQQDSQEQQESQPDRMADRKGTASEELSDRWRESLKR